MTTPRLNPTTLGRGHPCKGELHWACTFLRRLPIRFHLGFAEHNFGEVVPNNGSLGEWH